MLTINIFYYIFCSNLKHRSSMYNKIIIKICNVGSGDYGLFQISNLYWCSPDGYAACGMTCDALLDENIEDDMICARRIYRQHQRISGDGFSAWSVYGYYCKNRNLDGYVAGCFDALRNQIPKAISPSLPEVDGLRRTELPSFGNSIFYTDKPVSSTTERFIPKWKTSPKSYIKSEGVFPKFIQFKSGKSDYSFRRKGNGFQLFKVINEN